MILLMHVLVLHEGRPPGELFPAVGAHKLTAQFVLPQVLLVDLRHTTLGAGYGAFVEVDVH